MITLTKNGLSKKVKTGFSWKYLFFGVMYPMARGDFKGLMMQLLIGVCTGGAAFLVFPFTYNKAYVKRLIEQGYKPLDAQSEMWLQHNINYVGE